MIESKTRYDRVITNVMILDGTGAKAFSGSVAIQDDTIVDLGEIPEDSSQHVLDGSGMYLAPGFIDIHTHSDSIIFDYPTADSRVKQGITTEVTGNCGYSAAPLSGKRIRNKTTDSILDDPVTPRWTNVDTYLKQLEATGISVNHCLLVGQGSIRQNAMGLIDREPTADEMKAMIHELEESLEQGAFGLSTGLEYTPGNFTPTEELIELTRVVSRYGAFYASHIRNEQEGLLDAIDEAIEIGRQTNARVQISHLKANGRPNWGNQDAAIAKIEAGRARGVHVFADAYPYPAYSTSLSSLLSAPMREGGNAEIVKRLREPESRAAIARYLKRRIALSPGDYNLIVISRVSSSKNKTILGMNLNEIGEAWSIEPVDALIRLLIEENGSVSYVGHGMKPENVAKVLAHPLVMVGSDGSSMAPVGSAAQSKPHPRSYGTFPRVLGHYVREEGVLSLPEAIRKMTSMPADQIGLPDRGRIAVGKKADLVLFDRERVEDAATFENPHQYSPGIHHVFVNGEPVVSADHHTSARPGKALRRNS